MLTPTSFRHNHFWVFTMRPTSVVLGYILGVIAHGQECTSVTDVDGNVYPVVQIGTQCWMAENLRTGHYRDGSEIPNVTEAFEWDGYAIGAWCDHNNDPANDVIYGKLYNWHAVANGLLCPMGWHVANETEWYQMIDHLGGFEEAGGKMKSTGTIEESTGLWNSPNTGATNESGFTALPGGRRGMVGPGGFDALGTRAFFWNAIGNAQYSQWVWGLGNELSSISGGAMPDPFGLGNCVRCALDGTGIGIYEQATARFTVTPNPICELATINFMPNAQPVLVELLDGTGHLVESLPVIATTSIVLDMSRYEHGLYTLRASFNDGTRAAERLVKE